MLLADPQQLRQPGKGIHPDGADLSALQHGAKLEADVARDRRADAVLTDLGWRVLRCREDEDPDEVVDAICAELAR